MNTLKILIVTKQCNKVGIYHFGDCYQNFEVFQQKPRDKILFAYLVIVTMEFQNVILVHSNCNKINK